MNQSEQQNTTDMDTQGGAVIQGNVHIEHGSFIGRDQTIYGYSAEEVAIIIAEIHSGIRTTGWDGRSPYLGLAPFQEEDAEFFFGRETLITDLLDRIRQSQFICLTGPSGSGKSSLIQAGLLHALRQGKLPNSNRWHYQRMTPRANPVEQLALAVARLTQSPSAAEHLRQHGMEDEQALHKLITTLLDLDDQQRCVLFVDQFEELFGQTKSENERRAFVALVTGAVLAQDGRVTVILALRSDFLSEAIRYPALRSLMNHQLQLVGSMEPKELALAVVRPALEVGITIDPELVSRLIDDMKGEPGSLPLMQFTLKDLFDSQPKQKRKPLALTLEDYMRRGGIYEALERHADAVFARFTSKEHDIARYIFSSLIDVGAHATTTRRTVLFAELVPEGADPGEVAAVIGLLADTEVRLLSTNSVDSWQNAQVVPELHQEELVAHRHSMTVTVAHEKLFDAWPWLRRLVDERHEAIALQNEISADARAWYASGQEASFLYLGARLQRTCEQIDTLDVRLNELSRLFIDTGIALQISEEMTREEARQRELEQQRRLTEEQRRRAEDQGIAARRLRRLVAGLAAAFVLAVLIALFANRQTQIATARSITAQAQTKLVEGQYELALLLALEANRLDEREGVDTFQKLPYLMPYRRPTVFESHLGSVSGVAWSPEGSRIASGGGFDGKIILWDPDKGEKIEELETGGEVLGVAWSPDGRKLAWSTGTRIIAWNVDEGEFQYSPIWTEGFLWKLKWSPDGSRIAAGTGNWRILIWDLTSQDSWIGWDSPGGMVLDVAWSPDGKRLASCTNDESVLIWDVESQQIRLRFEQHTSGARAVTWSPDGREIASASTGEVLVWDPTTGNILANIEAHKGSIADVAWSPDGRKLASAGEDDNALLVWDAETRELLERFDGHISSISSVAWAPDSRKLVSGSQHGRLFVWTLGESAAAKTYQGHSDSVTSLAWSPNSRLLASGSEDGRVLIWDVNKDMILREFSAHSGSYVSSLAWSPDGTRLASGGDEVIVWDPLSGEILLRYEATTVWTQDVAWSPDAQWLVSRSPEDDELVVVRDASTGEINRRFDGYSSVASLAWSPDGQWLAVGAGGGFWIWSADLGTLIDGEVVGTDWVFNVAWSHDSQYVAAALYNGQVKIWSLDRQEVVNTVTGHPARVLSVAWSPGDLRVASGGLMDDRIFITNMDIKPILSLQGHTDTVNTLAWSPDGRWLASGSDDRTIRLTPEPYTRQPCEWALFNFNEIDWSLYRRYAIYQPLCANLISAEIPASLDVLFSDNRGRLLFTWPGRMILGGFLLAILSVVGVVTYGGYRLVRLIVCWIRR